MDGHSNRNWIKELSVPHLEGVKTHAANFISERITPRHVHHDYVFGLMVSGEMEIDCGHCNQTHILQPNDLLLTEPQEVYSSRSLGFSPWRYLSIGVSKEKLVLFLESLAVGKQIRLPHFTRGTIKNDAFRESFLKLYASLNNESTVLEQESRLLDWVASLIENYADEPNYFLNRRVYQESHAVRRVREFIRENVADNIKLQTLSEISGLSPFHLNRTFSAQIGLPPHEFQNQLRVEKATELMERNKPLVEIATEIGFSDQSHFNRFFKRYKGVTPKQFFTK